MSLLDGIERKRHRSYLRRKPEDTPLYRIVSGCADKLKSCWEEIFQSEYGALRNEVPKAFDAYLNCGILLHGCARVQCENKECNHTELIPFSCKTRSLCPSCAAKSSVLFAENLVGNVLLPHDHRHCVFTVPKRIRPFFKFKRELLAHLYHAAWESWKELALEQFPSGTPAAVKALHTSGDLLAFHPHVHSLNLSGVILPDGTYQPIEINQLRLQNLFADKVLSALLDEQLLTQDDIDNMKSWQHSGFNVFIGEPIDHKDHKRLLFAARYLKKCPLSNERLNIVEPTGQDSFLEYASFKDGIKNIRIFAPLHFLAEASQHIPDTWEQTVRYMGKYSARTRGANKENKASMTDNLSLPEPIHKPSANWARLMKKVFEFDPLLCSKCGSTMKIKAFITDYNEISRITKSLGIKEQRAPPKLKYATPLAA